MTKKDFFILLIKIMGLYFFIQMFFYILPQSYSFIALAPRADRGSVWLIFLVFAISILFFYLIIRYAHIIVVFLGLEKHFDSSGIETNHITKKDILQLGIIIIGGMLIVNSFVDFQHQILLYYRSKELGTLDDISNIRLAIPVLNILIGYLLMTNYDLIAKKIGQKNEIHN